MSFGEALWTFISPYIIGLSVVFLLSLVFSFLNTKTINPSLDRWSERKVRTLGGVAIFVGWLFFESDVILRMVWYTLEMGFFDFGMFQGRLLAGFVWVVFFFAVGAIDDKFGLNARLKLGLQFLVLATYLLYAGLSNPLHYVLAVGLFLVLINAVNMIDNMDGVAAATVAPLFLISWSAKSILASIYDANLILFSDPLFMVFALLVFLGFNVKNARLYLGDSGTLFLGMVLFLNTIPLTFFDFGYSENSEILSNPMPIFTIGIWCAGSVLWADFTTVFINRIAHKRSPMRGGKDHTTHHLVYAGLGEKWVAPLYGLGSVVGVSLAMLLYAQPFYETSTIKISLCLLYPLLIFSTLFLISRRNIKRGLYRYD